MRAIALLVVLLAPATAAAQDAAATAPAECAEGRVRGAEGLCCWPGQAFSAEHRACEGPPRCPTGLVEHGEACIASVTPVAPRYTDFVTPPPLEAPSALPPFAPEPPELTTAGWPAHHDGDDLHRAVRRHGEDGGLVAAAMVVFDIGWTMGLLVGILDEATHACRTFSFGGGTPVNLSCNSWPMVFIPVGGGIAAGTMTLTSGPSGTFVQHNSGWALGFGIPSTILQTTGLVMMAIALANEVHDIGTLPLGEGAATLAFVPAAPLSDVGVSAVLAF